MASYRTIQGVWNVVIALKRRSWIDTNNVSSTFMNEPPTKRFILVANHAHAKDPYVIGTILGTAVRYMANIEGVGAISRALSGYVGAFGKRKGMPDLQSLKEALNYLRAGEPVGIFPEGDRCWDGVTTDFDHSVLRMAKAVNASILLARQEGSYLSWPRWADVPRKGKWNITFKTITLDEIKASKQDDRLFQDILSFLRVDDISWAEEQGVHFSCPAPAKGVTRVLWACPRCGGFHTLEEDSHTFTCKECKSSWNIDSNCRILQKVESPSKEITFRLPSDPLPTLWYSNCTLKDWISWQKQYVQQSTNFEGNELHMQGLVKIEPNPLQKFGPGTLRIQDGNLIFLESKSNHQISFEAKKIEGFVDNFNKHSAFTYHNQRWKMFLGTSPHTFIQAYIQQFQQGSTIG